MYLSFEYPGKLGAHNATSLVPRFHTPGKQIYVRLRSIISDLRALEDVLHHETHNFWGEGDIIYTGGPFHLLTGRACDCIGGSISSSRIQ